MGDASEVKIKIEAEAAQAKREISQVGQGLHNLSGAKGPSALTNDLKSVTTASGELSKAVQELGTKWAAAGQTMVSSIPMVGPLLAGLVAAAAPVLITIAAIATAFTVAKDAVKEFMGAQVQTTSLDAALAAQGKLTDPYREKLQGMAGKLSEDTAIEPEKWTGALATLTKFGAGAQNIDQVAEATKNLAGFLGGDLEQAAFLVGKAMQGNYTLMGRYGIQVDHAATQTEKFAQVCEQLATKGGGQLEARAETMSGQFKALSIATGELFKGLGNAISRTGVIQGALGLLIQPMKLLTDLFPKTIDKVDGLKNKLQNLADADKLGKIGSLGEDGELAAEGMDAAASGAKRLEDQLKKTIDQIEGVVKGLAAIKTANAALELAKINLAEAKKEISPAEAAKRRAAVEAGRDEGLNADEIKAEREKLAALKKTVADADGIIQAAETKRQAARKLAETTGAHAQALGVGPDAATADDAAGAQVKKWEEIANAITEGHTVKHEFPNVAMAGILGQLGTGMPVNSGLPDIGNADAKAELKKAQEVKAATGAWIAALQDTVDATKEVEKAKKEYGKIPTKLAPEIALTSDKLTALGVNKEAIGTGATAKSTELDGAVQLKKEALKTEIALNEAKAVGNDKEIRRLEWLKEYASILRTAQDMGINFTDSDALAKISANAKNGQHKVNPDSGLSHLVTSQLSGASAARIASMVTNQKGSGEQILTTLQQFFDTYNATKDNPVKLEFK